MNYVNTLELYNASKKMIVNNNLKLKKESMYYGTKT